MFEHLSLLQFAAVAAGASTLMLVLWLLERRWRDASHVDAGWSSGIGIAAVVFAALGDGDVVRRAVMAALAGWWSLRLTWHLVSDRLVGKPEDGRYALLRERWGASAGLWFFVFFQAQALFVIIFSLPFWIIAGDVRPFGTTTDVIGIVWFVSALSLVWLADHQLARWRGDTNNRGRTCRAGLWSLSRHPNYFFEWLLWCAWIWIAWSAPLAWLVPLVPAFLLWLLLSVTGIPYNERRALATRGDDYRAYQREVSAFIPWFPRRAPAHPKETT